MTPGILLIVITWAYCCIRALTKPWIGFIGYVGFVVLCPPWNWRWGWYTGIDYQKFLVVGPLLGLFLSGIKYRQQPMPVKISLFSLLAYLFLIRLSAFQSVYPPYSEFYWDIAWKIGLMGALGVFLIDTPKKLMWFIAIYVISQGWNAFNVNQLYYQYGINVRYFTWNYLDNNTYSISTVPVMGVAFSLLMVSHDRRIRAMSGAIFVLQMHQLMFLQSRGTMIGALAMVLLGLVFMPKNITNICIVVLGLVAGSILAGPSVVKEFSSSFQEEDGLDSSATSRYELWKAGTAIMMAYPLLGTGPQAVQFVVPSYYDGDLGGKSQKALHNLFFDVGAGAGIPALIAYLIYFWASWFRHLRLWFSGDRPSNSASEVARLATLCGIPGYWISSMFSSGALIETPYLLVTLSCIGLTLNHDDTSQEHSVTTADTTRLPDAASMSLS